MSLTDPQEIQQAIYHNSSNPYGTARSARAEELCAAAERSGDAGLLRQALSALVDAYTWSSERTKALVPFARLLQEYDRDPGAFDRWGTHSLFWSFKWVTGDIIDVPEVPIPDVEHWFADMERRYRLAGHSERAVRQCEFYLAESTGDLERADRAVAAWTAAERDAMSNCHACELGTQGRYWAARGEDEKALEVWRPVTDGGKSCKEEPHRVLAHTLLPLLRLGRFREARRHHLKGYHLVRGDDSLLRSVGQHIEFCALTGNEARGLEILAEHAAQLGPLADVDAQLSLNGGILVLLRRLKELGHGDLETVRYAGSPRTAAELYELLYAQAREIAGRFDLRNKNTHISGRFEERIAREPLVDALPLGVRGLRLRAGSGAPSGGGSGAPSGAGASSAAADPTAVSAVVRTDGVARTDGIALSELVARARELRDQGHPQAPLAWERVAEALGTEEPDSAFLAAELLEHRAVAAAKAGAPDAGALLRRCRDAHRDAGHDARTALMELHLAVHAAASGDSPDAVRTQLEAAMRAARELWSNAWWERRMAQASLTNIRVQAHLRRQTGSPGDAGLPAGPEDAALSGDTPPGSGSGPGGALSTVDRQYQGALMEFVATTPDVPPTHEGVTAASLCDLIAEAEGELAQLALKEGDTQRADELLASAATRVLAADRPWDAAHPLAVRAGLLAALGRPDEAEQCARAALDAAELTAPEQQGTVRLALVDVLLRRDQAEEAVEHAIDAAHWFDQAGLEAEGGAEARRLLADAYRAQGRTPEAAEVLQSALPDLIRRGPETEVRTRATLAELLRGLREPRAAAEQLLRAADIAKDWDDPRPQARLALDAADCLQAAGLDEAADAAYGRALELWRACGEAAGEVRVLRALAWRRFRGDGDEDAEYGGPEGLALARPLFDRALAVLDEAADPELRFEHALTLDQYADMLGEYLEELGSTRDEEPESAPGEEPDPAPDKELVRSALDLYAHAAEEYGTLGAAHLSDRFEALHNRVWLAREHLPAAEVVAQATELIDELRAHGSLDAHRRADHLEKSRNTWRKG